MKIRNGFVSNSSSSSFVVAFPKEPKNVNDVKKMLFVKGQNDYPNPHAWDYTPDDEIFWSVDVVAEIVWNDIQERGSATKEDMIESLDGGFDTYEELPGHINVFRHDGRDGEWRKKEEAIKHLVWSTGEGQKAHQKLWNEKDEENEKRATKIVEKFMEKNPDATFYVFEYSDNDGSLFSAMEHGTLFRRVKHIKTSKH